MKKKLIFVNSIPSQFTQHKEYVKEIITDYFEALDVDCKLKVKFIDFAKINEYECTDCLLITKSVNMHELSITNIALKSINFDGGKFFCLSLYHEFEHIRDYVKMMNTKLFKFNLGLAHYNDFEKTYVSSGFSFWTEIYAYYKTLLFSKQNAYNYEKITFGNLVKNYIKTANCNKNIYYKKDLTLDEANNYVNKVDSFVYLCAKYMASTFAGHSRIPYARIDKNKNYKKVFSMLYGLAPKVKRLMNDPYGLKSYENLYKLGKYICENIRWKIFKVGLIEKNSKIFSFY